MSKFKVGDFVQNVGDVDEGYIIAVLGDEKYTVDYEIEGVTTTKGKWLELIKSPTTKTPHVHAELIKAWADGAEIQYWNGFSRWLDCDKPLWGEDIEYRIKPTLAKFAVALMDDNKVVSCWVANNKAAADQFEASPLFVRWLTDWVEYEVP